MFQTSLSSFLALFLPGLISLLPVMFLIVQESSSAEKYLLLLMLPFAYVAGWAIYEYSYYTKRKRMQDHRKKSWEKHLGLITQKGTLTKLVNTYIENPSTCTHIAISLVLQVGKDAIVRRIEYYLNSFRMLLSVPMSYFLGLILSLSLASGFCLFKNNAKYMQFLVLSGIYAIFLVVLVCLNLVLLHQGKSKELQGSSNEQFSWLERALYQAGLERQDQWIAALVRALAAIEFIQKWGSGIKTPLEEHVSDLRGNDDDDATGTASGGDCAEKL